MSKVLQKLTKYPIFFSFATSSIFVAFNIFFVGMGFDTNDDALMMHISAGSLSGKGSEYIIYSHIYLGQLYVWLYRCFPGYNWYPIFLVVIHWFSLTAILFFCNIKTPARGKTIVVFFLLCVETLLLQRLQFTSTSLVAAFAGLLLCLMSIPEKKFTKLILAFLLLLLSMLIRWESFLLVLFIGFLPLLFAFFGSRWRLFLVSCLFFSALIVSLRTTHVGKYSARQGQTIFNSESDFALRRIMDFPTFVSEAGLKSINWSENDFRLCKAWFWADSDFYTTENIKKLSAIMRFDFTIENKIFTMLRFIKGNFGILSAFLFLLFLMSRKQDLKQVLRVVLPVLLVFVIFFQVERIVPRVIIPILLGVIILVVAHQRNVPFFPKRIHFVVIGILVGFQFFVNYSLNVTNRQAFERTYAILNKYPSNFILNKDSAMNLEGASIWKDPRTYCPGNFLWVDVLRGYPTYNDVLKIRAINNLMQAIWTRDDIFVLADQVDDIAVYAKEHHQVHLKIDLIEKDVVENVHLFQLRNSNYFQQN